MLKNIDRLVQKQSEAKWFMDQFLSSMKPICFLPGNGAGHSPALWAPKGPGSSLAVGGGWGDGSLWVMRTSDRPSQLRTARRTSTFCWFSFLRVFRVYCVNWFYFLVQMPHVDCVRTLTPAWLNSPYPKSWSPPISTRTTMDQFTLTVKIGGALNKQERGSQCNTVWWCHH